MSFLQLGHTKIMFRIFEGVCSRGIVCRIVRGTRRRANVKDRRLPEITVLIESLFVLNNFQLTDFLSKAGHDFHPR